MMWYYLVIHRWSFIKLSVFGLEFKWSCLIVRYVKWANLFIYNDTDIYIDITEYCEELHVFSK